MSPHASPTRIILISHPATREQKAGFFPSDEPLDEEGMIQLASLSWKAPREARILIAPEQRTRQTAEAFGLSGIQASELSDCDYGRWRGLSLETLQKGELAGLSEWLSDTTTAPHGGESFERLMIRIGSWLDMQRNLGPVVAVTHASVIRAAVITALLTSPHQAFLRIEIGPLTITDIRLTGGSWRVRSVGVPLIIG
jgi:broad specificity phosphatase PhoE